MQHIGAEAVAWPRQPPLPQLLLQGQQEVHRCQGGGGGRAGEQEDKMFTFLSKAMFFEEKSF